MAIHPLAGQPAPANLLIDVTRLEREYYERQPDMGHPLERVSFGTSGHRGTPENGTFTEAHILAIAQAICDYRRFRGIDGPLFLGKDTHAVSGPAERTALEVLVANGVETFIQRDDGVTPTPVISWDILNYNHSRREHRADGIVVTPSHNPPRDGGFKYNPPHGAPIGGLKVVTASGWFAARPSGTENIYKIYAESFQDRAHLEASVDEAQHIINQILAAARK